MASEWLQNGTDTINGFLIQTCSSSRSDQNESLRELRRRSYGPHEISISDINVILYVDERRIDATPFSYPSIEHQVIVAFIKGQCRIETPWSCL